MNTHPFTPSLPMPPYPATIPSMLEHITAAYGSTDAVVGAEDTVRYTELGPRTTAISAGLLRAGATKGSRIGLLMGNSIEWVLTFLAITRIGAIAVPLSTFYQAPELYWVIRYSDIQILLFADHFLNHDYVARLEDALPQLSESTDQLRLASAPHLRHAFVLGDNRPAWSRPWSELSNPAKENSADYIRLVDVIGQDVRPSDVAVVIYTSGTTADPKGVAHAHGKLVRHTFGLAMVAWPFGQGDRITTTRPFFWVAGLAATIMYGLHVGACLICKPARTAANVLGLIRDNGLVGLVGREPWLLGLEKDPEFVETPYSVLTIGYGCSAIAHTGDGRTWFASDGVEARYPAARGSIPPERVARSIGMTETIGSETQELAYTILPLGREWSCGRSVPGMTFKVIDSQSGEVLPTNIVGELCVRGGSLTDYFYKRERCDTFEVDGFYRTGDLCRIDGAGFVFFEARRSEMLKIRGANVAPAEVERALIETGQVSEAAVVSVKLDEEDAVVAAVIRAPDSTLNEQSLIDLLKGRLSSFKVPRRIVFFEDGDLPRTGSDKISKLHVHPILIRRLAGEA